MSYPSGNSKALDLAWTTAFLSGFWHHHPFDIDFSSKQGSQKQSQPLFFDYQGFALAIRIGNSKNSLSKSYEKTSHQWYIDFVFPLATVLCTRLVTPKKPIRFDLFQSGSHGNRRVADGDEKRQLTGLQELT
jgi:hypothetical protein